MCLSSVLHGPALLTAEGRCARKVDIAVSASNIPRGWRRGADASDRDILLIKWGANPDRG